MKINSIEEKLPINCFEPEFVLKSWNCPICEISEERVLGFRGGKYQPNGKGRASRIVQCKNCALLYPNPFPMAKDLEVVYGNPEVYFSAHDGEQKIQANRQILRELRSRTNQHPKVLDVGSGCGELIVAAFQENIEAVGIEVAEAMVQFAAKKNSVQLFKQTIEMSAAQWPALFDGIVLNAVLEHTYHPNEMIASAKKLLKPGGVLYIDVPNEPNILTVIANAYQRLIGGQAVFNLSPTWEPFHMYGFNPRSLKALLNKHGFEIEVIKIYSAAGLSPRKGFFPTIQVWIANSLNHLGNLTGTSGNLSLWARLKAEKKDEHEQAL